MPGCPEFAAWTASIASARIAFAMSRSRFGAVAGFGVGLLMERVGMVFRGGASLSRNTASFSIADRSGAHPPHIIANGRGRLRRGRLFSGGPNGEDRIPRARRDGFPDRRSP